MSTILSSVSGVRTRNIKTLAKVKQMASYDSCKLSNVDEEDAANRRYLVANGLLDESSDESENVRKFDNLEKVRVVSSGEVGTIVRIVRMRDDGSRVWEVAFSYDAEGEIDDSDYFHDSELESAE